MTVVVTVVHSVNLRAKIKLSVCFHLCLYSFIHTGDIINIPSLVQYVLWQDIAIVWYKEEGLSYHLKGDKAAGFIQLNAE